MRQRMRTSAMVRQVPPGYVIETGTVERVNGVQFRVNREAVLDYAVGRPLVLLVDGKTLPAVVHQVGYNTGDSKTYVTTNVQFSGVPSVARDASLAYVPGVDRDTAILLHFDTASLGLNSCNSDILLAASGTPVAESVSPVPKFGAQAARATGTWGFYSSMLPYLSGSWTVEMFIWGQIAASYICGGAYAYGGGGNPAVNYLGIDASYRPFHYNSVSGVYTDTFTSDQALLAGVYNHVAWSRDAATNKFYAFVNGVGGLIGTRAPTNGGGMQGIFCLYDGYYSGIVPGLYAPSGFITDEIRISTVCRYTSNFTAPPLPFGPNAQ